MVKKLMVGVDIGGRIGYSSAHKKDGKKQPKWMSLAQVMGKSKTDFNKVACGLKKQFGNKKGWEIVKENDSLQKCYSALKKSNLYFDVLVYDKTKANQLLIKNKKFKKMKTKDSPEKPPFRPHFKQVSMPIWDTADEFEKAGFKGKIYFKLDNDFGNEKAPAIKQLKEEMEIRYRGKPTCKIEVGDDKKDPEVYLADIVAALVLKDKREKKNQFQAILKEKATIRIFKSIKRELKTKPQSRNKRKIKKFLFTKNS